MDPNQTTPIVPPPSPETAKTNGFQISAMLHLPKLWIVLGIGIILIVLFALVFFLFPKKSEKGVAISGGITYTALKPDPEDRGAIQIWHRPYGGTQEYELAYTSTSPYETAWIWNQAVSGQAYELRADLIIDGKVVTQSEPLIVTAPASNQMLDLRVTWHTLPESVVREQTTSIKGTIALNGYIPTKSTLLIQTKSGSDTDFQTIVSLDDPKPNNSWTWEKAVPLKDYALQAVFMEGNVQIGKSQTMTAAGGDNSIAFTINSLAVPPVAQEQKQTTNQNTPTPLPTKGTIAGTVTVNGPEKENTSLLMLWRYPGEKDYKEITRINNPSHNGQSWSWNDQIIGKQYEITAVLQVNQQNTASTQSQFITAPAQNVHFTLNTGIFIPTPNESATVNACNSLGNNQYSVALSFPRQSNAGNYWIQVGRSGGASDIYNAKIQDTNNNPQISLQIEGNRSYFAQYAYSLCKNCSDDQNFSNFSSSKSFSCGGGTVYTGYICASNYTCQQTTDNNPPYAFTNAGLAQCQNDCRPKPTSTSTPTPSPIPTSTSTPTPTPKIAYCNESCGGNGYICNGSLVCTSGGVIGSSVCRNAECPDDEACNCLPK